MKISKFTSATSLIVLISGLLLSLFNSCEGPAGPPGEDANESCNHCHNDEVLVLTAMVQHSNSGHQMGTTFERSGTSCAPCHTHQGYLEVLVTGEQSTSSDVSNPLPANCRTCHRIHENFDSTDFALRNSDPVEMWIDGTEIDLGSGNQCINCHQARVPNPLPTANAETVSITSSRWGPHHGVQANIVWGSGAYEVSGSEAYENPGSHPHKSTGCNGCHMAEPFGAFAGGHTFSMTYMYHGKKQDLVSGCTGCHPDIEDFDLNGAQTNVMALVNQLETILIDLEYINPESGLVNASSSVPLELTPDRAGALLNYYFVLEDGSMGVHNPDYTVALLQNSIEVFN